MCRIPGLITTILTASATSDRHGVCRGDLATVLGSTGDGVGATTLIGTGVLHGLGDRHGAGHPHGDGAHLGAGHIPEDHLQA